MLAESSSDILTKWSRAEKKTRDLYEEKQRLLVRARKEIDEVYDEKLRQSTDEEVALRDAYYRARAEERAREPRPMPSPRSTSEKVGKLECELDICKAAARKLREELKEKGVNANADHR